MDICLRLEVVTPRRQILDLEVTEVRLPGALGELGVLPGHTPLLTTLAVGPLTYFVGSEDSQLAVSGGFAEVLPDRVTVLAREAETPQEIDAEAARADLAAAEEALKSAGADDLEAIISRQKMATTRLAVAADEAHA